MFLPAGWSLRSQVVHGLPWATLVVLLVVLALLLCEMLLLHMPPSWQEPVADVMAWGRHNQDPYLGGWWQWWTGSLFMPDPWFAAWWSVAWIWAAGALERRCGALMVLACLVAGPPVAQALADVAHLDLDRWGNPALPAAAWGVAAGSMAKGPLFWSCTWRGRMLECRQRTAPALTVAAVLLVLDVVRLLAYHQAWRFPFTVLVWLLTAAMVALLAAVVASSLHAWWQQDPESEGR